MKSMMYWIPALAITGISLALTTADIAPPKTRSQILRGGQYLGPPDLVPPNCGEGGCDENGEGVCPPNRPASCSLTADNSYLGTTDLTEVYPVAVTRTTCEDCWFPYPYRDCHFAARERSGDASWVYFYELKNWLNLAKNGNKRFLDLIWAPPNPGLGYQSLSVWEEGGLRSFCQEGLAMFSAGNRSGTSAQFGGGHGCRIVGSPAPWNLSRDHVVNQLSGFEIPDTCDPLQICEGGGCDSATHWQQAHFQNLICLTDEYQFEGNSMTGIRIRLNVDCLDQVLQILETSNPGYYKKMDVMFEFVGLEY